MKKLSPKQLKTYGKWHWLWRGLFELQVGNDTYSVDVDYFDFNEKITVYKNGTLVESKRSPVKIAINNDAVIEAELSTYGMKHVQLKDKDGAVTRFTPSRGTPEAWRSNFSKNHPLPSKLLGIFSWTVLVIAAITQLPELISLLSQWLNTDLPTFELPLWANLVLSVAGVIAAIDRALQFKHNKWID